MRGLIAHLITALLLISAVEAAESQSKPEFQSGFRTLADLIPHTVGDPIEDEHVTLDGDSIQHTTAGVLVWRKTDNTPTFTDGTTTWLYGRFGLQTREAGTAFLWEPVRHPPPGEAIVAASFPDWTPGPEAATGCTFWGSVEIPEADSFGSTQGDFSIEGWAIASCPGGPAFVDDAQVLVWGPMGSEAAVRLDGPGYAERVPRPDVAASLGEGYLLSGFRVSVDSSQLGKPALVLFRVYLHVNGAGWWERSLVFRVEPRSMEHPETDAFITNTRWKVLMEDRRLQEALAYAYHFSVDFRPLADRAAARGTRVGWEEMPRQVDGRYDPSTNLIVLNKGILYEPVQVAAAMLAHETLHGARDEHPVEEAGCLQEEIDAYSLEVSVWEQMPRPEIATPRTRILDMLVRARDNGILDRVVTESSYYREYCGPPS